MNKEKLLSEKETIQISRNEIYCNIADIMKISSDLLKSNGKLFMIHRPSRLNDILFEGRKNNLELKTMRMIYPNTLKSANLVLLQFTKNSKPEIKLLPPLFIHEKDGRYTKEVLDIYSTKQLSFDE